MRVAVRTVPHSTQRQWGCPKGLARKKIWRYLSSVLNTQLAVVVAWYLRLLISEPPSCLVGRTELHTIVNSWDGIGTGFHNRILCMVLRTLCWHRQRAGVSAFHRIFSYASREARRHLPSLMVEARPKVVFIEQCALLCVPCLSIYRHFAQAHVHLWGRRSCGWPAGSILACINCSLQCHTGGEWIYEVSQRWVVEFTIATCGVAQCFCLSSAAR